MGKRTLVRSNTRIQVACSNLQSSGRTEVFNGTMRNCSCGGTCIELDHSIQSGSIIVIKATDCSGLSDSSAMPEGFRSVALAEVKWSKVLKNRESPKYAIGLRYLPN